MRILCFNILRYIGGGGRTVGIEASYYDVEEKSIEITQVVANEKVTAQTESVMVT